MTNCADATPAPKNNAAANPNLLMNRLCITHAFQLSDRHTLAGYALQYGQVTPLEKVIPAAVDGQRAALARPTRSAVDAEEGGVRSRAGDAEKQEAEGQAGNRLRRGRRMRDAAPRLSTGRPPFLRHDPPLITRVTGVH